MEERFHTFTILITGINRSIRKIKTAEMSEFNLKSTHVSCLYYLHKAGPLTAKELCDICGEDKAVISRSIRHLEENDYLICHAKTAKRYQSPLLLTEKGSKLGKHLADKIDSVLDSASVGLDEYSRNVLYKSLALIHDNLQKICKEYEDENEN